MSESIHVKMPHCWKSHVAAHLSFILGSIQEQSVLGDIARKDSLSLKVEFINLNISRSRKLEIRQESLTGLEKHDPVKSNIVRFSGKTINIYQIDRPESSVSRVSTFGTGGRGFESGGRTIHGTSSSLADGVLLGRYSKAGKYMLK